MDNDLITRNIEKAKRYCLGWLSAIKHFSDKLLQNKWKKKNPPCYQEMTMTASETESQNDGQVLTWAREFPISPSFMRAETIARLVCCLSYFPSN